MIMRQYWIAALALCILPAGCETSGDGDLGVVLGDVLGSLPGGEPVGQDSLSQFEIDAALRQALEIGTDRVVRQIGVTDGFWADDRIRIPLPGRLGKIQRQLSGTPLARPLDDLQLRMNRAAEQAVPAGKQIVVQAIQGITISDAMSLLRGGDSAATDFLRTRTEASLRDLFTPYVDTALTNSGAYRSLEQVTSGNPLLLMVAGDLKSDLTTHAVQLGLDGVFTYLASEEKKIRDNPVARSTELLRKVFGAR
ncbi:MAG: DUF4197 domain-containing protein [Pseudomonadota bacterium]